MSCCQRSRTPRHTCWNRMWQDAGALLPKLTTLTGTSSLQKSGFSVRIGRVARRAGDFWVSSSVVIVTIAGPRFRVYSRSSRRRRKIKERGKEITMTSVASGLLFFLKSWARKTWKQLILCDTRNPDRVEVERIDFRSGALKMEWQLCLEYPCPGTTTFMKNSANFQEN